MKNQIYSLVSYFIRSIGPIATLPIIAHLFNQDTYGKYLFFLGVGTWITLIIDFGFNISATKKLSEKIFKIEYILAQVQSAKFLLLLIIMLIVLILYIITDLINDNFLLINLSIIYGFTVSLIPIYYFHGEQKFIEIAKFELICPLLLLIFIYLFINSNELYKLIIISIILRLVYLYFIVKYIEIKFKHNIFLNINFKNGINGIINGVSLFIFNFTTSFYNSFIIVLIGLLLNPVLVGIYSTADKIIKFSIGIIWQIIIVNFPISINLFNKNNKNYIQFLLKFSIFILLISITQVILIKTFVDYIAIIFNQKTEIFISVLEILSLGIPAIVISSIIITNYLFVKNKENLVNAIVMVAAIINITGCLVFMKEYGIIGIAKVWLFTEWFVTFVTAIIFLRELIKKNHDDTLVVKAIIQK